MELTLIIMALYAGVILFHWIPLVKSKNKKEIWVSSVLTAVSFVILILYTFNIYVYSPSQLFESMIHAAFPFTAGG